MPPKRIVTSRTASKGDWAAVPGMAKTASYSTPCRFFSGERIACHTDFRGTGSAYSDSGARGDPIMHPVVGIFTRREDAERAAGELEPAGIDRGRIIVLTPGTPAERPTTVPTRETEPPGIGTALGTMTGAAAGAAGGMQLGTVLSTLLVPGLGPVIALGALGTVLLGALGAAVGHAFDDAPEGVPKDDLFLYEDALRHGRSVVIVLADDDRRAEVARAVLSANGAESLDAFRERWWKGTRRGSRDRKSTRLNSSHLVISYAVFCLKKKKNIRVSPGRGNSGDAEELVRAFGTFALRYETEEAGQTTMDFRALEHREAGVQWTGSGRG